MRSQFGFALFLIGSLCALSSTNAADLALSEVTAKIGGPEARKLFDSLGAQSPDGAMTRVSRGGELRCERAKDSDEVSCTIAIQVASNGAAFIDRAQARRYIDCFDFGEVVARIIRSGACQGNIACASQLAVSHCVLR